MQQFICDGCGKEMTKKSTRYTLKIDVRLARNDIEFTLLDLFRDHRKELEELIEKCKDKSEEELEETIYKGFEFDLCPSCQRAYIQDPLRFHPEQGVPESDIDIDAFLKSIVSPHESSEEETD